MFRRRRYYRYGYAMPFDAPREGGKIYSDNQYSYASKFMYEVAQQTATTPAEEPEPDEKEAIENYERRESGTPPEQPAPQSKTYKMGQEIEANYFGTGYYERGTIVDTYGDGGYIVEYTDGDREAKTALGVARDIREVTGPAPEEPDVPEPEEKDDGMLDAIMDLVRSGEPPEITRHTLSDGTVIIEYAYQDKPNEYSVEHGGTGIDKNNLLTQQELRRIFNGEDPDDVVTTPEYIYSVDADGVRRRDILNADGTRIADNYYNRGQRDIYEANKREEQRARDEAMPFGDVTGRDPDDFAEWKAERERVRREEEKFDDEPEPEPEEDSRELLEDDGPETREEAIARLQNQHNTSGDNFRNQLQAGGTQDDLGIGGGVGSTEHSGGTTFTTGSNEK